MVCSSKLKEYFNSKNVTSLVKASTLSGGGVGVVG